MDPGPDMSKRMEQEDWEYFAQLARTFQLNIEAGKKESSNFRKELQMTKEIIHAYLSTERGREQFLSTKSLTRMYKTIAKLEAKMAKEEHAQGEFLTFLRALLHKMELEKLVVYKTREKKEEFLRHKPSGDEL